MTYKVLQDWDVPQEVKDLPAPAGYADHYGYGDTIGMRDEDAQKWVEAGILEKVGGEEAVIGSEPEPFALSVEWKEGVSMEEQQAAYAQIKELLAYANAHPLPDSVQIVIVKRT